ncbi:MAG: LamG domain-containing protein, partial [Planctomycetes bacterium]|nr:LamG domain-containing protein [Planctomycetota bacterium]
SFALAPLEYNQTYYWRVDEVNDAPDSTVSPGVVWSFATEPFSIPISNITATASGAFGASGPENTINGSGLTGDLHGVSATDMWISAGIPATVEYAFDRAYKLHELWVWNSNQTIEPFIGFGAKDVAIEHSLDGDIWTVLESVGPLAQAPGVEGYAHNNTIDFGGVQAQHVRMTINTVQGFAPQASLSEVRFFYIPTFPTGPNPPSGSTDVAADVTLSWARDGREAAGHDIYLGSDPNALSRAGTVTESSFDTLASDLQLGQTYYWQVVEVNDAMDPSEWAGAVWSFATVDTIIVDDMESYKDEEFLEIWATWIDGFDDPGNNGAIVGANPPLGNYAPESTIVYGGSQSLPIHFDNSAAPLSEATNTFDATMDWSKHGVQSLVLFFRGSPANTGGQLYLKINDTKVAYDGSSSDLMHLGWNRWTIPLSSVSASTLSRVTSLTIGIEGAGSGVLYVDEIQLTTDARVVVTPTEPSDEALVAHYAFDGDASDSTGQSPGTLMGLTSFVPGVNGEALRLDGIVSYVAIDGLFYDSDGFSGVSVTTWLRTDVETDQIIASFDRSDYWRLEINLTGAGPGQIGWDVMTDAGQLDNGSSSRVDDGEWHHVAGVFDKGTSTIFIDGYHEAPVTGGSTLGSGNLRYGFVGVGSEAVAFDGAKNGTPNYFFGDLDDVRIYHRALSAAEVAGMAGRTDPFEQP